VLTDICQPSCYRCAKDDHPCFVYNFLVFVFGGQIAWDLVLKTCGQITRNCKNWHTTPFSSPYSLSSSQKRRGQITGDRGQIAWYVTEGLFALAIMPP
jgi:hypothetical protein